MKRRTLSILAVVLVGVVVEGVIALTWAHIIPACGCQNANGQPYYWCPQPPCPSIEGLNVESSKLISPTNMTLNIRNTGSVVTSLVAYYVKDSANNQYARSDWAGPTIATNALVSVNILVNGRAFAFQSGTTYAVEIVTSRYSEYFFTIIA